MKTLVRLSLAVLLACFIPVLGYSSTPRGVIYFLNVPETIKKPGVLMSQKINPLERSRIFWHYKNATGRSQLFELSADGIAKHYRAGFHVSSVPANAGTEGMMNFQRFLPSITGQRISIKAWVPSGYTISGVAEGVWDKASNLVAKLGAGPEVDGIAKIISQHLFLEEKIIFSAAQQGVFRVGESRPGHIPGNYGSTIRLWARYYGPIRKKARISFSPRGGNAVLIYRLDGRLVRTSKARAKSDYFLFYKWLNPDESFYIDVYPIGGFNYPLELRVRVAN